MPNMPVPTEEPDLPPTREETTKEFLARASADIQELVGYQMREASATPDPMQKIKRGQELTNLYQVAAVTIAQLRKVPRDQFLAAAAGIWDGFVAHQERQTLLVLPNGDRIRR